jgi:hypothetical protein
MTNRTEALVPLPPPEPQRQAGASSPAFGFSAQPPEEPSVLWTLARRHHRLLLACGGVSLLVAWVAGWLFARPLWQAEAILLYQPVQLTAEQQVAYAGAPSVTTLAGWLKDPRFLGGVLQEQGLGMSPAAFADQHLKVDQPLGTEVVGVTLKWSDRKSAQQLLDLLLDRFTEFVVAERKKSILQRCRQAKLQELSLHESEVQRLDGYIRKLGDAFTGNQDVPASDLDGILFARRDDLPQSESWRSPYASLGGIMLSYRTEMQDRIRREEQQLGDWRVDLLRLWNEYERARRLESTGASSRADVDTVRFEYEKLKQRIETSDAWLKAKKEELRTLPIYMARMKRSAEQDRAEFLQGELRQLDDAMQAIHLPSGPNAPRVLAGMDESEFKVQSKWIDNQPASSNRRTLTALTFLVLMGLAFGLLFAYDRSATVGGLTPGQPPSGRPSGGGGLVHVASRIGTGVTIARVDVQRLSVRLHQWLRGDDQPNGHVSSLMIGPNGHVEEARQLPPATPVEDDVDRLTARINHWLDRGSENHKQ